MSNFSAPFSKAESALQSITFGTGVDSIGTEAFSDCTNMTRLMSRANVPPVCGTQALDDINKWTCRLYVPDEAMNSYKMADQWKEFFFIVSGMEDVTNDADNVLSTEYYTVDGKQVMAPAKGLYIIVKKYTDGTKETSKVYIK